MGIIHLLGRGTDDVREFKHAVKKAREAIDTICELTEEMEEEFGGESGYSERRGGYRMREGYNRGDWDGMERRGRDSRGRYM